MRIGNIHSRMCSSFELLHLFRSPGHNYIGHHGKTAGSNPIEELDELECVANVGVTGDRFYAHQNNFKGQITFFASEVYEELCRRFSIYDKPMSVFRRNVVTRGVDLQTLIGVEFELQGIRFFGTETCKPCYWMDQAFCPGAEEALKGRGGLRARIITSGVLRRVPQVALT